MFRWLENEGRRYRPWILVGLTILFVMVVRIRLRETPLERDEGEYAYAGQLILQGVPPYKEVYNMKLPGTYAAYALIMSVLGQTPAGIHLGVMLVNIGSIILMFLIGRKLLDDVTGVVAAVSYALLSLSPYVLGLAGHATHFVVLFALAGIFVLMLAIEDRGQKTEDRSQGRGLFNVLTFQRFNPFNPLTLQPFNPSTQLFTAGLLLGLAFLMKQHGIFFCVFGVLFLFWARFSEWWAWRSEQIALSRGRIPPRPRPSPARAAVANTQAATPTAPRLNAIAMKRRLQADGGGRRSEAPAMEGAGQTTDDNGKETAPAQSEIRNPQSAIPVETPQHSSTPALQVAQDSRAPIRNPQSAIRNPSSDASTLQPFNPSTSKPPVTPVAIVKQVSILSCGILLPYLFTCLVLWGCGAFHQFVFWTITYARQYASSSELYNVPQMFKSALEIAVGPNTLFWILPWAGAFFMWTEQRLAAKYRFFLVALLLCCFASISVGFYFREHYFITLLPALALLIGVGLSRGFRLLQGGPGVEMVLAVVLLVFFVAAIGASVIGSGNYWFGMSPAQVVRNGYSTSLFADAAKAAGYIRNNTAPQARIAVLGSEPEIPFYAHRRSVTGHIYMYPLMEHHQFSARMQDDMIAEIEKGRPEYVVYVEQRYSWLMRPDSEHRLLDWWSSWSSTNMDLIETLNIEEGPGSQDGQDKRDTTASAPEPAHILIYRLAKQ